MLAVGGNSGNVLYDASMPLCDSFQVQGANSSFHLQWFIGRELNPRIGIFDIKTFK